MRPNPAAKEDEVADRIEEWRAKYMKLQLMDTKFEDFPQEWAVSSLRGILVGRIKEHVDL